MKIKADEISSIIKEKIENFDLNVEIEETGKIISVADGVAKVYGLKNVMAGEMVEFENGEKGMTLNLEEASVGIVILGKGEGLKEGSSVKRLKKLLKVPVGDAIIGRVVNALGEAKGADVAIAFGKNQGLVIRHGEVVAKLKESELVERFLQEVEDEAKSKEA